MNPNPLNQPGDVIAYPKLGRGQWVVVATCMTGGGTGHGPGDVYPDGHQLILRRLKGDVVDWTVPEKRFYQSGSFVDSVMLPYLKPVRRLG
jgi:hypothetical protein